MHRFKLHKIFFFLKLFDLFFKMKIDADKIQSKSSLNIVNQTVSCYKTASFSLN